MSKIYFKFSYDFRFVLAFILENCLDCKILTEIENYSNHFGIKISNEMVEEGIISFCLRNDIVFDRRI